MPGVSRRRDTIALGEIYGIEGLALKDIVIKSFQTEDGEIRFKEPLHVHTSLEPEFGQTFCATVPELALVVHSNFQDELAGFVKECLAIKWKRLTKASDERLAKRALKTKKNLLSMVVES